jgi:hypothetical protein
MTTLQTEFTEAELLDGHDVVEPVIVDGLRCHGGFLDDGTYVSPRTKNRVPAIEAWEQQRLEQFSTPLLEVPFEAMPPNFPSIEQSKFLLRNEVPEPTIAALTRIGTLEGLAGLLRLLPTPDFARCFEEDITGTAIAHIDRGLFEAHARDESGYDGQAGHDRMWFQSRDIAFEHPLSVDENAKWMSWLGLLPASGTKDATIPMKSDEFTDRVLPDDIDGDLELVATRMIGLLFIEVWAFHSFDWASGVLSDKELVAGEGSAATLVDYIRRDEAPHIAWLRTALSEMRDRTWVGTGGRTHPGTEMLRRLWDQTMRNSVIVRRQANLDAALGMVVHALEDRPDGDDLLEEMLSMGTVIRRDDGSPLDTSFADTYG